ncbi:MAG: amino acid adenylation domain-containing protein [Anaerolineae bacterium]|nr:amino acid adenylation domain-containing protein [Anaerolineae bacterium]
MDRDQNIQPTRSTAFLPLPRPEQSQCLHHRLETQAIQTPHAVAVVYPAIGSEDNERRQLTYQELNQRANRLAHRLQMMGVGPEVPVGICVERSPEMMIGLLAILKAGGAYVPLDPSYPREHLAFMLADADVPVLLTQQKLLKNLARHGAHLACLDGEGEGITYGNEEDPASTVTPDNLAYIIYTSGSTGQPKGVQVTHRSVVNLIETTRPEFGFDSADVWTVFHSYAFDFSVWEIWAPLLCGSRLVIVPPWVTQSPEAFYDLLLVEKVTVLNQTPSAIRQLVPIRERALETGRDWSLRLIICGGEALPQSLADDLLAWHIPLWNFYGPTEATVWAATKKVEAGETQSGVVALGRPLPYTQLYVLDDQLQPTLVGEPGELCIGGIGLARGYFKQPTLTAEKFIPNPFVDMKKKGGRRKNENNLHPSSLRLYKTGDLARIRADGDIEFLGRLDHQVKLRGYRIELGEIEAVLEQHPLVRQAVVIAHSSTGSTADDQRLVAYVVQNSENSEVGKQVQPEPSGRVGQWELVWDEAYRQDSLVKDPTFNISGWNSSYTNQPVPAAEVREWVEATVKRILALQPERVLEIGCGTGLLLFRIAPHCVVYWAADISAGALNYLKQQLAKPDYELPQVKLLHQAADDFTGIEADAFDAVVLNGVTQYFPHIDYLVRVLERAVNTVAAGGFVFVGDVRSLPLLEAYHLSVQLQQAPDSLPIEQFWQRVQHRLTEEEELVVAPAFFRTLPVHLPQINYVEIHLKRGRYHNEFTRFRYDVVLHVGTEFEPVAGVEWLDWPINALTIPRLRQLLLESEPELLGIKNIPNARLWAEVKSRQQLAGREPPQTVKELRQALSSPETTFVDPEDLWALADDLPYDVDLGWLESDVDGAYTAIFRHRRAAKSCRAAIPFQNNITSPPPPWTVYANTPRYRKPSQKLGPQLRHYLRERLPPYMLPSAFVFLDTLPLTPNGKIDRRALPPPTSLRPQLTTNYVAPRNHTEAVLAELWTEILDVEQVGIYDDFIELGGHSLLATQLVSRIRNAFGLELSLRILFETSTVASLARYIDTVRWTAQSRDIDPRGDREEGEL